MSITLASVFDDRSEALRARDRLIEAGVDGTRIRIEDNQEERGPTASRDTAGEPRPRRRSFFAELFGLGDDDAEDSAGHFAEAVRRGSTVLAITLPDEARVSEVSEILEDCGAVDIDHRVEQWRAGGYERHDEHAPVYRDEDIRAERKRLVEEDLGVGKPQVESGRVRVHRRPRVGTEVQERTDTVRRSDVYSGPDRRVANDASYRGPERRRAIAMQ